MIQFTKREKSRLLTFSKLFDHIRQMAERKFAFLEKKNSDTCGVNLLVSQSFELLPRRHTHHELILEKLI